MGVEDKTDLRSAFATFITGVTVVTALNSKGVPLGFTANSFTSVSLDPPLLLVCPAMSLTSYPVFEQCEHFAVNILAENQHDVSNVFASFSDERFSHVKWSADAHGCPLLQGSAATFSCRVHQRIPAGDHMLLIGEVEAFETTGKTGLGYVNNGYFSLELERLSAELPASSRPLTVGAIIEYDGQVLVEDSPEGLRPPQVHATDRTGSLSAIRKHLTDVGMHADFGPVYSIFENNQTGEFSTYYRAKVDSGETFGLGRFVSVEELTKMRFASNAMTYMINRYVLERKQRVFHVYVGDEMHRDVQVIEQGKA